MRRALCLLIPLSILFAQQPAPQTADVVFSSNTQLVIETVGVKDKSGAPIEGLTAKDFTVTENGVAQEIKTFEYQRVVTAPPEPEAAIGPVVPVATLPKTSISPEKPGDVRYRDRRLLAMYFDMSAMPPPDQTRALDAARRFIRTQMTPSDVMAVLKFEGGAVQVLQDFTGDRNRLLSIVETMIVGEAQNLDEPDSGAGASDTGTPFGQDDSEFNIFNTDRQLAAIQTAARMLGQLSEKKSLIYFASGLQLNGTDNQAQLNATVNAAIRAGVSLYPIDARGLVATAPLGDATRGSPGGLAMYTGAAAIANVDRFQRSQDTLYSLAADTGGKASFDSNDLAAGMRTAQNGISSYYLIGYYTTNQALDGKFRRVKITLNGHPEATLDYRQGYYQGKEFNKFTAADKERQLEDALMLQDPITELTIAMEVNYFQLNRAEYFVPVAVKIPGRELALARRGGAEHTLIDFIGEVKDEFGSTVSNVRDKVDVKLTGETAAELTKRPVQYDTGFTLLPGTYNIKFLARDAETGRIGTWLHKFTIPNLNKEEKRVAISSVVLSSQRLEGRDALFNAKDKLGAANVNPLLQDGRKLIPSVTRVFSRAKEMYVYLQAYEQSVANTETLVAFATLYQGDRKAFETTPIQVTEAWTNRVKTVPIAFTMSLDQLTPGKYNCQVTILNPAGQKAAFWQAPVVLVP
jgi:VWFA-related protein